MQNSRGLLVINHEYTDANQIYSAAQGSAITPDAAAREKVAKALDGDFDQIHVFGGRSVSIRDHQGRLVWDSGEMFERLSEAFDNVLTVFNTTSTANARDNRSDDKGVEPESLIVGHVSGRSYAFVGLERDGGLVVLDISNPSAPVFVTYATNRKLPRNATGAFLPWNEVNDCGDLGPEGLTFVPADRSPTGAALLLVSDEVSSTTTIWEVR